MSAARETEFQELKKDVRALERDFNAFVDERVAEILREMAATVDAWPSLSLSEHLNNAAKKLEERE